MMMDALAGAALLNYLDARGGGTRVSSRGQRGSRPRP
jgi:hypothetical protein